MKSMTAFVSGIKVISGLTIRFNLASYNSRFIDINLTLPDFLIPYSGKIYDKVKNKVARGRIEMQVYMEDGDFINSTLYQNIVGQHIKKLSDLKKKFKLEGDIDVSTLIEFSDAWGALQKIDFKWEEIESFLGDLLTELNGVKEKEGEFIKGDLAQKINDFEDIHEFILQKFNTGSEEKKEKILEEIKRLNALDIQISREDINLFAFKGDINEELVRLKSHIKYFRELLDTEGAVGKRLKFLLQEMAREANTIGSKAFTADVVHKVIDLKELLDELREQVENIE